MATEVILLPDTPEHHHAHAVAKRAHAAGYQPIITAASSRIWVMVAYTPDQLTDLLDRAGVPP